MTRRKGSSTNAAPSALDAQAQSEDKGLDANQAGKPTTEPKADAKAAMDKVVDQPKPIVTDSSTVEPEDSPELAIENTQISSVVELTDKPQTSTTGQSDKLDVEVIAQAKAVQNPVDDPLTAIDASVAHSVSNDQPKEPKFILKVHNLTGSRLYEPSSNTWLDAYRITVIESKTLKQHQLALANVQELSRLKRGRLEILND